MGQYFGRLYPALLATLPEPLFGVSAYGDDPGRETCPHCGYLEYACACEGLHAYRGAFDEPHQEIAR